MGIKLVMRTWLALASLLLSLPLSAAERPRFQPIDVFSLEYASDPQISPDGTRIAYTRTSMDVMKDRARSNLWILGVDGAGHRPLGSGSNSEAARPGLPTGTG